MSGLPPPAPASTIWPYATGSMTSSPSLTGPTPFGGGPIGLPTVNNPNLPLTARPDTGYQPPPIPQTPRTPFPSLQQPFGQANSLASTNYAIPNTLLSNNAFSANLVPNPVQTIQNEVYHRRLKQLENENTQRRNTTLNLQQMGTHILQGQSDVQEQVLQYQYMLEQCLQSLDHQNFILNGQTEELALLRSKMRQFDYLIDALKNSKEGNHLRNGDSNFVDNNLFASRNPLSLPAPSTSPFVGGGVTRVTSSKFQPFNQRYRSPTSRTSNINEHRSTTPSVPNPTPAPGRLSRPISNPNN